MVAIEFGQYRYFNTPIGAVETDKYGHFECEFDCFLTGQVIFESPDTEETAMLEKALDDLQTAIDQELPNNKIIELQIKAEDLLAPLIEQYLLAHIAEPPVTLTEEEE